MNLRRWRAAAREPPLAASTSAAYTSTITALPDAAHAELELLHIGDETGAATGKLASTRRVWDWWSSVRVYCIGNGELVTADGAFGLDVGHIAQLVEHQTQLYRFGWVKS